MMKTPRIIFAAAVVTLVASLSTGLHAQPAPATPRTAAAELTDAEVRKVDKDSKKITLKHGAIKNLDMPPMTMVFQVSDPAMLERVKAGDKVRFTATGEGGKYTLTDIQAVQ